MKKLIPAIYEDGVFKPLKTSGINIKEHSKINLFIIKVPIPKKKSLRLKIAKKLCSLNTPVSDWNKMEKEIEKGFLS